MSKPTYKNKTIFFYFGYWIYPRKLFKIYLDSILEVSFKSILLHHNFETFPIYPQEKTLEKVFVSHLFFCCFLSLKPGNHLKTLTKQNEFKAYLNNWKLRWLWKHLLGREKKKKWQQQVYLSKMPSHVCMFKVHTKCFQKIGFKIIVVQASVIKEWGQHSVSE